MKDIEIKISLVAIISFFLHVIIIMAMFIQDMSNFFNFKKYSNERMVGGRDIIVNINEDNRRKITKSTLLSDKDSLAKGYITTKAGDRWLNNSLDFKLRMGKKGNNSKNGTGVESSKESILLNDNTEVVVLLEKLKPSVKSPSNKGEGGEETVVRVPDRNNITRQNSIFYSNSGIFSFNTAKFKNFKYFKGMKDKIAANWYPPIMANSIIGSYNPETGSYTPGVTRILAIPNQEVKLYFIMNREGEVLKVEIVESYGNRSLNSSCVDAIKLSKEFGKVPDDIKGEVVVIPFIFGFYTY